jgi:GST-like protein
MDRPYELIGSRGCGSMIVEIALDMAGLEATLTDLPYLEPGPGRDRLLTLNPLGQVPTLILPDGRVMTESAAMLLHIGDVRPESGLVPKAEAPERAAFLDHLVRMVAAVYPTFTFGDDPLKFAVPEDAVAPVRQAIDGRRLDLFRHMDAALAGDTRFAFGERPTAVDLYLAVMAWWRPGRDWFRANVPRISGIADAALEVPAVARAVERHQLGK